MKKKLEPFPPINKEEWGDLPLWRPHLNHIEQGGVRCSTKAQRALRDVGFLLMKDILDAAGILNTWMAAMVRGALPFCKQAFRVLRDNLRPTPTFVNSNSNGHFYVELLKEPKVVWKYLLPTSRIASNWMPFMDRSSLEHTYMVAGGRMKK